MIEDRQLPVRSFWKYAIVKSGSIQPLFESITFKKVSGGAGESHFILITTACPQVGIFDAGDNVMKVTIIGDRRSPTAGTKLMEVCSSEIRQRSAFVVYNR